MCKSCAILGAGSHTRTLIDIKHTVEGLPILKPHLYNSHVQTSVLGQLFSYVSGRLWRVLVCLF